MRRRRKTQRETQETCQIRKRDLKRAASLTVVDLTTRTWLTGDRMEADTFRACTLATFGKFIGNRCQCWRILTRQRKKTHCRVVRARRISLRLGLRSIHIDTNVGLVLKQQKHTKIEQISHKVIDFCLSVFSSMLARILSTVSQPAANMAGMPNKYE